MKRINRKRGFTMAEMLIVVAIIGVLAAVAFIAVNQHERSLERLERDSVAREIFVAAQNHLTMAQSQGYLGLSGADIYGTVESKADGTYYFAVNRGDKFSSGAPANLLDLMLPFGAIDETVRAGGSYIIRYHPESGTVMDVFYCSTDDRFGYDLSGTDVDDLKKMLNGYREHKENERKNFKSKVLGWYGGETAKTLSKAEIYAPLIVVENADKLRVGIQQGKGKNGEANPTKSSLQVIVTGVRSGVQKVFTLKSDSKITLDDRASNSPASPINGITCDYEIILDDITTGDMHFADLVGSKKGGNAEFDPGEDVIIQAIAFDNTQISNIAKSAEITVNSLYEKVEEGAPDSNKASVTAYVNNIRHLENLDKRVSNVTVSRDEGTGSNQITYTLDNAVQTSDISWSTFKENTNAVNTLIYGHNPATGEADAAITSKGCFLPVSPDECTPSYVLSYDGKNHSVSDIKVDYAGNVGLFGSITGTTSTHANISNLALIDFDIKNSGTGSGNAGALAGTLKYVDVTNVVAYEKDATDVKINAGIGNAGGLIGSITDCIISKSAASLIVTSENGDAGGLIGKADGTTSTSCKVSACYSGGHTITTASGTEGYDNVNYNVTGKGNAGGLIGNVTRTPIEYSYSTCSVKGDTAGGFVGTTTTTSPMNNCYATGLVFVPTYSERDAKAGEPNTTKVGAFAGAEATAVKVTACYYYDIINEVEDEVNGVYISLSPAANNTTKDALKLLDETAQLYDVFVGAPADWKDANAYDAKLIEYYNGKYNLQTVEQLGATLKVGVSDSTDYFVATHYGDWPAPEIFVSNTKSK